MFRRYRRQGAGAPPRPTAHVVLLGRVPPPLLTTPVTGSHHRYSGRRSCRVEAFVSLPWTTNSAIWSSHRQQVAPLLDAIAPPSPSTRSTTVLMCQPMVPSRTTSPSVRPWTSSNLPAASTKHQAATTLPGCSWAPTCQHRGHWCGRRPALAGVASGGGGVRTMKGERDKKRDRAVVRCKEDGMCEAWLCAYVVGSRA